MVAEYLSTFGYLALVGFKEQKLWRNSKFLNIFSFFEHLSVIASDIRLVGPLEEHTSSQIESLFESNVYSTTRIIRSVLPVLKKQHNGKILVTNTQAGIFGIPFHSAYSATKFAVNGLLESLAPECLRFNI